jgi:phosphoglycerol transferase MdoB-like AlkP superfamily enzyme
MVLLLCYQLVRFVFLINNYALYESMPLAQLAHTFGLGARFDLSAILILNFPYLLFSIWPFEKDLEQTAWSPILKFWFVLSNGVLLFFNIADVEYFQFIGRRLTVSSFAISQDIGEQFFQTLTYYWYFSILSLFLFAGLWWLYGKGAGKLKQSSSSVFIRATRFLLLLSLISIGIRGGTQPKPLNAVHAYQKHSNNQAQLMLNSTFTILKSYKSTGLQPLTYYKDWDQLVEQIPHSPLGKPVFETKPNVVIIILESFNLEYTGLIPGYDSYTPFLDQLSKRGKSFTLNFANGRRSIDALPSIIAGIPTLMDDPLIASNYRSTNMVGLPKILKEHGYANAFFHGGHDGTMYFDVLTELLGFEAYFGSNAYNNPQDDDGRWGIFDEPFLQYSAKQISTLKEPFMATAFTLSSHHPYTIPGQYADQFEVGTMAIHPSIRYADFALKRFFETASQMPWYKNTLFVLTADHTSKSEYPEFQSTVGIHRVPLIFFHPQQSLPLAHLDLPSQHIDIMPTILDLIGIEGARAHFGHSLRQEAPRQALFYRSDSYYLLQGKTLQRLDSEGHEMSYLWQEDQELTSPSSPARAEELEAQRRLRAYVQYFHNGLIENKLNY